MKKYLLPVFLILNVIALISLGLVQYKQFNHTNDLFELAVKSVGAVPIDNLIVKARNLQDATEEYYYVRTMVEIEEIDGYKVYAPLFCSVTQVANALRHKTMEYDEQEDFRKRTFNAVVVETAEHYVVVQDANGDKWQIDEDFTVTPVIEPAKDQSPSKISKELKIQNVVPIKREG